jgi:hypothetical protein
MSKEIKTFICKNCETVNSFKKNTENKFCSNRCQRDYEFSKNFYSWMRGEEVFKFHVSQRRALIRRDGEKCVTCGIYEWNGRPLTFEVEHRDGNSDNNHQSNLELICPNCHSQTDTYKGKNKGNGRHARRVRYAQGKSY